MAITPCGIDPLTVLPPEIILRILEFTPIAAVSSLTAVSQAWHQFIDITHQEAIYGAESKTNQPPGGARDFAFLSEYANFSRIFEGTASWKDLCKRQTLLARNWAQACPTVRESLLQVGNDPIWRFRPDFKRRYFVSTSHAGGLNVTDMDTGQILWRLPSTLDRDEDAVRPYAHLEYQDGMAVFDREGDAVEVWQAELEGAGRGEFRRIAVLNHDCQTRGFQLSHGTLCVVSSQGQGFVYDMTQRPPKLNTHLKIAQGAVGHLDQSADVVIYSIGAQGYHVYDKASGVCLGVLHPSHCTDKYHIRAPPSCSISEEAALAETFARYGPRNVYSPRGLSRKDCFAPIEIHGGPLPPHTDPDHVRHGEDEWGAGMLHGDLFVGFSRAGRVFVCSNWRKAIHDQDSLAKHSSLIECESDGASFDLGGWLSVRNHRIVFEIQERVYVVALDDNDRIQSINPPTRPSYSMLTSSAPQLNVPVSYMTLCDDALMTTFTTLGWRQPLPDTPGNIQPPRENPARIFPTKTIRVVNLAPDDSETASGATSENTLDPDTSQSKPAQPAQPAEDGTRRARVELLQILSMLDDLEAEVDEVTDPEVMVEAFHDPHVNEEEWEDEEETDQDGV